MLTTEQLMAFCKATAYANGTRDERDLNDPISWMCPSLERVAQTRESIEDFFAARGRKLKKDGSAPAVPFELNGTPFGDLYIWANQQARKGARRGSLYVMNFGEFSAAYFDGEA